MIPKDFNPLQAKLHVPAFGLGRLPEQLRQPRMLAAPRLGSAPPRQAVAAVSWRTMVERPPAANDDIPPELSQTTKLIIGAENEIELKPDAWARFERAVDVAAKSPPQHRIKGTKKPPAKGKRRTKKRAD
jgi:hypothetical protein